MKMPPWQLVLAGVGSFSLALLAFAGLGLSEFIPSLLAGAVVTLQITAGGTLVAIVAALIAAAAKLYGGVVSRAVASAYIELFRGTSALVQLFWLFYVLPHFGVTLEPMTVGIVALGLNVGAYGAEVVRGAVQAVPKGQWEAATALNFSGSQALFKIILPQAFVGMLPPWGNLLIELLKATALVSLITLSDLAFISQQLNQNTLRTVEIFTLVLFLYLGISLIITAAVRALERRASRGLSRQQMDG